MNIVVEYAGGNSFRSAIDKPVFPDVVYMQPFKNEK